MLNKDGFFTSLIIGNYYQGVVDMLGGTSKIVLYFNILQKQNITVFFEKRPLTLQKHKNDVLHSNMNMDTST